MGAIHETLTLEDKFSASFTRFIQLAEDSASSTKEVRKASREATDQARALTSVYRVAAAAAGAQAANQRRLTAEYRAQKAESAAAILAEKEKAAKSRSAVAAYREQIAAANAAAAAARQEAAQTRAAAAAERLAAQQKKVSEQASESATTAQRKYNQSMREGKTAASGLGSTLRSLAATYLSFQSVKGLAGMSDQVSQIDARLRLMTGSEKAAAEAQDAIYAAALRSRGAYTDMAAQVAKLGTLAGDAFTGGTEQIVAFTEQLQKQMRLSGTSTMEAQAAMLQLTQGLSSGILRGEELNSVLEQTPMIAQTIAEYMGVTTGEMRELASQGKVTSDVVVNAILGAAEETNAAFAQLPMTWADVWTQMQNIAIKAMQPVLNGINYLANHIDDALQWVGDNMDLVVAALAGIAAAAAVAGGKMVASAAMSAAAWAAANWPILAVAAAVGVVIFAARKMGATWEEIGGVVGTVLGHMYASVMNVFLVPAQRQFAAFANFVGNFLKNPVGAVIILFHDMALTVLGYIRNVAHGMEDLINKIPGFQVNLTSGIDAIYKQVEDAAQKNKDAMGWEEFVKPWDYVDYMDAWNQGAEIGGNLGSKLDSFNMQEFISQLSGAITGGMNWDEFLDQVEEIGDSVSGIEKSVDLSDEDLKSLVDVAERRYVNNVNLTAQTPVITVNGANTGRTAADRQSLANTIRDILLEESASGAVRSTAAPVMG